MTEQEFLSGAKFRHKKFDKASYFIFEKSSNKNAEYLLGTITRYIPGVTMHHALVHKILATEAEVSTMLMCEDVRVTFFFDNFETF